MNYVLGDSVRRDPLGTVFEAKGPIGTVHALVIDGAYKEHTRTLRAWAGSLCELPPHPAIQGFHEFVDVGTLLIAHRAASGAWPINVSLDELRAHVRWMAVGLAHAHAHGVVHGGLIPSAVVFPKDRPVIVRVGQSFLARSLNPTLAGGYDPRLLHATAPELLGSHTRPTPASDVYALGVLAYEWLTGCVPHGGHSSLTTIIQATLNNTIDELSTADASFNQLVQRMLSKSSSQRPSASDVARALAS